MANGAVNFIVAGFVALGITWTSTGAGGRLLLRVLSILCILRILLIRWRRGDRRRIGWGRLVGQRTRYATGQTGANLLAFIQLTRTQYGLRGIAVWPLLFFCLFFIGEIQLRGDLRVDIPVTDNR